MAEILCLTVCRTFKNASVCHFITRLRDVNARVVFLGADVPTPELLGAVRRTEADVVSLSATAPNSLPVVGLAARALVTARVHTRLFVGGPALDDSEMAREVPGIRLPAAIDAAADTLIEALNGSPGGRTLTKDAPLEYRLERPELD